MRLVLSVALATLLAACGRGKHAAPRDAGDAGGDPDGGTDVAAPEVSTTCVFPPRVTGDVRLVSKAVLGDGFTFKGAAIAPDGRLFLAGLSGYRLTVGGRVLVEAGQEIAVVLAFDAQGALLWHRILPPGFHVEGPGLDAAGRLYVTISNPFAPNEPGAMGFQPGSSLVQLDAKGASVWGRVLPEGLAGPLAVSSDGKIAAESHGAVAQSHVTTFDAQGKQLADTVISGELIRSLAWDGAGHLLVAGSGDAPAGAGLTGSVQALDGAGKVVWRRWFAPGDSVGALATRGARIAVAGAFNQSFMIDGHAAAPAGYGDVFVAALDQPPTGEAVASWLDSYATSPLLASFGQSLAFDGRGGLILADSGGSYADLGTGTPSPPGSFFVRLDEQGHTTSTLLLSTLARLLAVGVDASDRVVTVGAALAPVDLGDGVPVPGQSFFVATYAPQSAPAQTQPPCPPLLEGALLDSQHWDPLGAPGALALGPDRIFFATFSEIAALPLAGGAPQLVAWGQNRIGSLAFSDGALYWANMGSTVMRPAPDGEIMMLAPGAATPTVLANGLKEPTELVADGATIYWVADGQLWRLTPGVDVPTAITTGFAVKTVAAAAGHVAFGTDKGDIVALSGAGTGDVLAHATKAILRMAVDADAIYWIETNPTSTQIGFWGDVHRVALAGGEVSTLDTHRPAPLSLAVTSDRVYWTESWAGPGSGSDMAGAVRWMAPTGGALMTFADGFYSAGPLAVDATNVAWVSQVAGGGWAILARPLR